MEWYEALISIITGLATAIPLVIELTKYVKQSIKEKNWGSLVSLILNLMSEAESKFDDGLDKRQWVLEMVQASANTINYEIDLAQVGELIDSLCVMSKTVNASAVENDEEVDA
jgi:hypothetical protein